MHRIALADGTHRQSKFLRWSRTLAYALFGVAGALLLLSPVVAEVYGGTTILLSWFMFIGGTFAAAGSATHRWIGEFCGLPLLAAAFFAFGLEAYIQSYEQAPYLAAANLATLAGLTAMMVTRWRVVFGIYHMAREVGKRT